MSNKPADPKKPSSGQATGERPSWLSVETAFCKQVMLSADSNGASYSVIQFVRPSEGAAPSRNWQSMVSDGEDASLADHFDVFLSDGEVEEQGCDQELHAATVQERQADHDNAADMSTQDRYIDARLEGIEKKLDARMEALQRFQEQADVRAEKAVERVEKAVERAEASNRSTRWTVIGTGLAVIGLVATILYGNLTAFQQTVSDQGAWLRQSVERIESKVDNRPSPDSVESVTPES
ncbi:hemolysin XhlA family protein [Halomonas sp. DP8Y7-1]|uniref:hemolysin XhlA family protein n=1 Tax=Halomonas sp. DP8Y7-1 TaxID=2859078 RepID=UPI001C9760BB|nr:hemolysin XhlA family protein [Halomonas sp. DP8Y7-1]MBY6030011.1 hemolysin XhlA family protein [Halomonas sp. DP8Y7-1]